MAYGKYVGFLKSKIKTNKKENTRMSGGKEVNFYQQELALAKLMIKNLNCPVFQCRLLFTLVILSFRFFSFHIYIYMKLC